MTFHVTRLADKFTRDAKFYILGKILTKPKKKKKKKKMSSATILHSLFSGKKKRKKKHCKMTSAEIFTQYAERQQIYKGVNIVLFANILYLVISLIRLCNITKSE